LVRGSGDIDAYAALLAARGLHAERREGGVVVRGADEDALLDAVRDAAADAGLGLRELRPAGRTLEDALVDALE
jgi:hypothetical protein